MRFRGQPPHKAYKRSDVGAPACPALVPAGRDRLPSAPEISFPSDEGRHPWTTDEWWYFNCHVRTRDAREYGFAVCFFPAYSLDILVDLTGRSVLHKAGIQGLDFKASSALLDLRVGKSWWRQTGGETGSYAMHYEARGLRADLTMKSQKRPLLVDGGGKIREGLLGESYYYAQTHMQVDGEVELSGERVEVTGKGWIDRQWGRWEWSGLGGWRWFSVQLENDFELLGIEITHPLNGRVAVRSYNLVSKDGEGEVLRAVSAKEIRRWRSPDTGIQYPVEWSLSCAGRFDLRVVPVVESQEINPGLWEGSCTVAGSFAGEPVAGRGFLEISRSRIYGGASLRGAMLALGVVDHVLRGAGVSLSLVDRAYPKVAGLRA
jgi:predicted secreted hydrolase